MRILLAMTMALPLAALCALFAPVAKSPTATQPQREYPPAAETPVSECADGGGALSEFLAREPACYTWTECFGEQPIEHDGGLVFYQAGGRIYSYAWYESAENVQPWPLVEGVGTLVGNTAHICYRNGTQQPEHEYYEVACQFNFNSKDKSFSCSFMQKVNDHVLAPLLPGNACGSYLPQPPRKFRSLVEAVKDWAKNMAAAGTADDCCPVVPRPPVASISSIYQERTYRFCCRSCRTVFLRRPAAFAERP